MEGRRLAGAAARRRGDARRGAAGRSATSTPRCCSSGRSCCRTATGDHGRARGRARGGRGRGEREGDDGRGDGLRRPRRGRGGARGGHPHAAGTGRDGVASPAMDAIDKDRMLEFRGDDLERRRGREDRQGRRDVPRRRLRRARVGARPHRAVRVQADVRAAPRRDRGGRRAARAAHEEAGRRRAALRPAGQLTKDQESELYRHYGVERDDRDTDGDEAAEAPAATEPP